jgi:hypothetical protein
MTEANNHQKTTTTGGGANRSGPVNFMDKAV